MGDRSHPSDHPKLFCPTLTNWLVDEAHLLAKTLSLPKETHCLTRGARRHARIQISCIADGSRMLGFMAYRLGKKEFLDGFRQGLRLTTRISLYNQIYLHVSRRVTSYLVGYGESALGGCSKGRHCGRSELRIAGLSCIEPNCSYVVGNPFSPGLILLPKTVLSLHLPSRLTAISASKDCSSARPARKTRFPTRFNLKPASQN